MRCWECGKLIMVPDGKPPQGALIVVTQVTCSYCRSVYGVTTNLVGKRPPKPKTEGEEE